MQMKAWQEMQMRYNYRRTSILKRFELLRNWINPAKAFTAKKSRFYCGFYQVTPSKNHVVKNLEILLFPSSSFT